MTVKIFGIRALLSKLTACPICGGSLVVQFQSERDCDNGCGYFAVGEIHTDGTVVFTFTTGSNQS